MHMKQTVVFIVAGVLLTFVVGFAGAPMTKFNIGGGHPSFPAGTQVLFTIGGEGCDCTSATHTNNVATSGSRKGFANVSFTETWNTTRGALPNKKCKAYAVAVVDGKLWVGNASLTGARGGTLTASIDMAPKVWPP